MKQIYLKIMKYTTTKKCLINFPFQPPNDWGMPSIGEGMLFSWIYEVPDRVWRTIPSTSVKNDWSWNSVWDWRSQLLTLRSGRHWLERVFFNWSGQSVSQGGGREGAEIQSERLTTWSDSRGTSWRQSRWNNSSTPSWGRPLMSLTRWTEGLVLRSR